MRRNQTPQLCFPAAAAAAAAAAHQPPACAARAAACRMAKRQDYDYLVKLLLIGDSGAWLAAAPQA